MHLGIAEVDVANGDHNGVVRLHLSQYVAPGAQRDIDRLAARNQDVASALLISESQVLVLEASRSMDSSDDLKRMANGFGNAFTAWYEQLDEETLATLSHHANVQRDAARSYSSTGWQAPVTS